MAFHVAQHALRLLQEAAVARGRKHGVVAEAGARHRGDEAVRIIKEMRAYDDRRRKRRDRRRISNGAVGQAAALDYLQVELQVRPRRPRDGGNAGNEIGERKHRRIRIGDSGIIAMTKAGHGRKRRIGDMAVAGGRRAECGVVDWIRDGAIDTLSGDDVPFLAMLAEKAGKRK